MGRSSQCDLCKHVEYDGSALNDLQVKMKKLKKRMNNYEKRLRRRKVSTRKYHSESDRTQRQTTDDVKVISRTRCVR